MKGSFQEPDYDCSAHDYQVAKCEAARGNPAHVKPQTKSDPAPRQFTVRALAFCAFVFAEVTALIRRH